MASLTNNTPWPVPLPNGLALDGRQTREVSNEDLDAPDMARALPALVMTGDVSVSRDQEAAPEPQGEPEPVAARFADMPPEEPEGEPEPVPPRMANAAVIDTLTAEEAAQPEEMPARSLAPDEPAAEKADPVPEAAPVTETLSADAEIEKGA